MDAIGWAIPVALAVLEVAWIASLFWALARARRQEPSIELQEGESIVDSGWCAIARSWFRHSQGHVILTNQRLYFVPVRLPLPVVTAFREPISLPLAAVSLSRWLLAYGLFLYPRVDSPGGTIRLSIRDRVFRLFWRGYKTRTWYEIIRRQQAASSLASSTRD